MSKKIIAILTIATILFVCVFAACEKKEEPYQDSDEINAVTDENGEFVLAEDGRYIVYVTDAEGERVTDKNGEYETEVVQFTPTMKDGVIEDYGFKLKVPDGWKVTDQGNVFERKSGETLEMRLVKKTYEEYYKSTESFYGKLFEEGVEGSLTEDASLVKGAEKAFKLVVDAKEAVYVTVVCYNHGNLYNLSYKAENVKADLEAIDAFLAGLEFKPYTYYPVTTEATTAEATTK